MSLRIYNTLSRTKEDFTPLDAKNVRLYVCGPTVYDFAHIGNARPAIVFDVLFRLLRHTYGESHVTYVRNITDVDDKINARAASEGITIRELTDKTYEFYANEIAALGCLRASHTPRATEHIGQMIAMIETLITNGNAYEAQGHVLFNVSSKSDYGKLSRRSLDDMIAGARVEVAPYKKGAMDFVLWKPSDENTPGWESPWGRGRPGWHIECSAMAGEYLGETFDIHGGGIDLVFPHHENEIAQSEAANHNHPLAKVWMHNGFLNVEGEKMSKSLGNFVTLNKSLKDWDSAILRWNMLRTHYRQPIDWTLRSLKESERVFRRWYPIMSQMNEALVQDKPTPTVLSALSDDLNTPLALTELSQLINQANSGHYQSAIELVSNLRFLGFMPWLEDEMQRTFRSVITAENSRYRGKSVTDSDVKYLQSLEVNFLELEKAIEARNVARKAKDFAESDRIRDELLAQCIVLKDGPEGTTWEVKR